MMADGWGASLQWWEEWPLRVLVLGSLGVQWLLLLAGPTRRYAIPRWFRACICLARRGSDPLAIYALAVVFLRHAAGSRWQAPPWPSSGALLEVLWAPVLLAHLGGRQLEMTASAACDVEGDSSEVWTRHAMVMVSQVAIALYTFLKSWPSSGDGRLTASWVLLFVVGILTLGESHGGLSLSGGEPASTTSCWEPCRPGRRHMVDSPSVAGEGRRRRMCCPTGTKSACYSPTCLC